MPKKVGKEGFQAEMDKMRSAARADYVKNKAEQDNMRNAARADYVKNKDRKQEAPRKPSSASLKMKYCMYHLQGVCKYPGETCAFAHSTEEMHQNRGIRRKPTQEGVSAVGPAPANTAAARSGRDAWQQPGGVWAPPARAGPPANLGPMPLPQRAARLAPQEYTGYAERQFQEQEYTGYAEQNFQDGGQQKPGESWAQLQEPMFVGVPEMPGVRGGMANTQLEQALAADRMCAYAPYMQPQIPFGVGPGQHTSNSEMAQLSRTIKNLSTAIGKLSQQVPYADPYSVSSGMGLPLEQFNPVGGMSLPEDGEAAAAPDWRKRLPGPPPGLALPQALGG